jgi:hypothetical protein
MSTFVESLVALWSNPVNINDLPESDPIAALGRTCETLFTDGVDVLRASPNDRISALARVVWDLIGHKQIQVVIGPDVQSLTFTCMQLRGVLQGFVLVPKRWPEMIKADAFMQSGALLFVGAQLVDFHNDRLINEASTGVYADAPPRWYAYEAEFLRTIKQLLPDWAPNEYQRKLMEEYPDGLDSAGVELYAFKGYEPARGST